MSLAASEAPLVWIDCEMSGLAATDVLLQIACIVTDANLRVLDPECFNVTIARGPETLAAMDAWCTATHAATGLSARVLAPDAVPIADAAAQLLAYVKRLVPERGTALLAGNTVHADKVFLVKECPAVVEWLNYRILDVSAIKEGARRWCAPAVLAGTPKKKGLHEAEEDIRESIEECRYWRDVLFRPAKPLGADV